MINTKEEGIAFETKPTFITTEMKGNLSGSAPYYTRFSQRSVECCFAQPPVAASAGGGPSGGRYSSFALQD
jgi:hypothetical protein